MIRFFITIILFFSLSLRAQSPMKLSVINLSVVMPLPLDGISESHISKLQNKIIEVVNRNGLAATGIAQNFIIYPILEIYDEKKSQAGMRSITLINGNLSLFVKQNNTNIIFSSYSKKIQGSGFSKNEALNAAISSIEATDPKLIEFVRAAREKIVNYFEQNCEQILRKAQSERNIKNYESALSILLTVPEEVNKCFERAQTDAKIIFGELQSYTCNQYLQKARAAVAINNYNDALMYLSWVDPTGPCSTNSRTLISSIEAKVDAETKKNWDFLLKVHSDDVALERLRIEAMSNVAIAWLKSQPSNITTINVIK